MIVDEIRLYDFLQFDTEFKFFHRLLQASPGGQMHAVIYDAPG